MSSFSKGSKKFNRIKMLDALYKQSINSNYITFFLFEMCTYSSFSTYNRDKTTKYKTTKYISGTMHMASILWTQTSAVFLASGLLVKEIF